MLRQSQTATALAQWLAALARTDFGDDIDGPGGVVSHVWHTRLQDGDGTSFIGEGKQMTSGPACFAILLTKEIYATHLGHHTKIFIVSVPFHFHFPGQQANINPALLRT